MNISKINITYPGYNGLTELESFMRKKRMKNRNMMNEKTSYKYFKISLDERIFCYKINKNFNQWRRRIPFENMLKLIPKLTEIDQNLCEFPFGFQVLTTEKSFVLYNQDEFMHYNWLRIFEFIINKKDIGSFENYKKNKPISSNPIKTESHLSRSVINEKSVTKSSRSKRKSNLSKSLLLNVNENDGTIKIKLIPKTNFEFEVFKKASDRINAKPLIESPKNNKIHNFQSQENIKNKFSNEWMLDKMLIDSPKKSQFDNHKKIEKNNLTNLNFAESPILYEEQNSREYTNNTIWTFKENILADEDLKKIEKKVPNKNDEEYKKNFSNSNNLHIKEDLLFHEKFQIENLHCGIDREEMNIDRTKNIRVGTTTIKSINKIGGSVNNSLQEEQNSILQNSVNPSDYRNSRRKKQTYNNTGDNMRTTIQSGGKTLNVDRDIVEDITDNTWTLNLTIKEKK